ncbi:MAG: GH32 C-terminal domain-containing protein, partial [Bacillota bacterium]
FSPRIFKAPLKPENNRIQLHIYIDHSTVEVFGNGGQKVISALTFPETANDNLELYVKDGQAELISLEIYELDSIW